ncbi:response regulator, partial [Xanthomonas citri pv. citri]|nr:response regulator [Xanthomonas citri pv. citri]
VVLDLGLPRLDGLEVLRRLRAGGNAVPVLSLTARDATDDRIAGLDAGSDDYLIKPFDLNELKARLRALLRRNAGRAKVVIEHAGVT